MTILLFVIHFWNDKLYILFKWKIYYMHYLKLTQSSEKAFSKLLSM